MLTITLLGTAATMPLPDRALTAAVAECGGHSLLLDCGEGTQTAARRAEHQGTHHHGQGLEGDLQIGGLHGQGDAQHEIGRSQQGQTAQKHGFFFGTHKKQNAPFTACCHERSLAPHGSGCGFSDAVFPSSAGDLPSGGT